MRRYALGFFSPLLFAVFAAATDKTAPIDIGTHRELFVDDLLIDSLENVSLRLNRPVPEEAVLAFDKPWEGRFSGYVTVIEDNGTFRMYYRGLPEAGRDGSNREVTCYAESIDGIRWTKPALGLHDVGGTHDNNVVLAHQPPFSHNFSPFVDTRPNVPADECFKALAGTRDSGLVAFVSPDGIRWRKLRAEPVITEGAFDSQNVAFWSESENRYCAYFRTWTDGATGRFRTVSRSTSSDFVHWSAPVEMDFGDAPREHIYTNNTLPYFRAPRYYIGIAARFFPGRRIISESQMEALGGDVNYSGDISDAVLLTSRGGQEYDRTFMAGFVRPGYGPENWTSRTNYPAYGLVQTGAAEMSFYVTRNYGQDSAHLQRMSLRLDGFASIHAPYEGGDLVTKPLVFGGTALSINYSTSAAGSIRVELQDVQGRPIPGYELDSCDEIIGDEIVRTATWRGESDVSSLRNEPIRLRFVLRDADLYSLQFQ